MNAGQIVVQMSTGTNGAMSMISPVASVPVSEQDGSFAGILSQTFAQEGQAVAQLAAESKKPEFSVVSELKKAVAGKDTLEHEEQMPVMMASLLAVVETAVAQPVITNAVSKVLTEEQQPVEEKMPQNVELNTAEMQMIQALQVNGRMPASEQTADTQVSDQVQGTRGIVQQHTQVMYQGQQAEKLQNVEPVVADEQNVPAPQVGVKMPETAVPIASRQQTQQIHHAHAVEISASRKQVVAAEETAALQSPELKVPQNVGPTLADAQVVAAPQIVVNMPAAPASRFAQQQTSVGETTAVLPMETQMPRSEFVESKSQEERLPGNEQTVSFMLKPQMQPVPAAKVQDRVADAPVDQKMDVVMEASELKTVADGRENAMSQKPASKNNAVHDAVQYISRGVEVLYGSKPSEVTAVSGDKSVPSGMGEFRFAGSVAVDVELGNAQQVSDRNVKKSESVFIDRLMAAGSNQLEVDSSDSTEFNFTSSEQSLNGNTQEIPVLQRPVAQHVAVAHQPFVVETGNSTQVQPASVETTRMDVHENVANQVRERLDAHDLKAGNDQIVFRLSPENMGEIKVHLRLEDQRLRVEIVAENRVAREGLLQHVDSLKESLSRQNISMDKFSVTSGESQANSQGGNNAQGEWRELAKNRQSQQWLNSGGYRLPSDEVLLPRQVYQGRTEHAMLDVHF